MCARAPSEGVIKYQGLRLDGEAPATQSIDAINQARTVLFDHGLIGAYADGVAFGNVSVRTTGTQFLISASATGAQRTLAPSQYCLVAAFDIARNTVQSRGAWPASSESLTHGALYAAEAQLACVLHVHQRALFDTLLASHAPHTPPDVAYGTPAMAHAVAALLRVHPTRPLVFAMAGHDEGVVACGVDVAQTLAALMTTYERALAL